MPLSQTLPLASELPLLKAEAWKQLHDNLSGRISVRVRIRNNISVIDTLILLDQITPNLLTQKNFEALVDSSTKHREAPEAIHKCLHELGTFNRTLLTQKNFQKIIDIGQPSWGIGQGIEAIGKANPASITQEIFQELLDTRSSISSVAECFAKLAMATPNLLTPSNIQALQQVFNTRHCSPFDMATALRILKYARAYNVLLTQGNLQALIDASYKEKYSFGSQPINVACGLEILSKVNINLITHNSRYALIKAGDNAKQIAQDIIDHKLVLPAQQLPLEAIHEPRHNSGFHADINKMTNSDDNKLTAKLKDEIRGNYKIIKTGNTFAIIGLIATAGTIVAFALTPGVNLLILGAAALSITMTAISAASSGIHYYKNAKLQNLEGKVDFNKDEAANNHEGSFPLKLKQGRSYSPR